MRILVVNTGSSSLKLSVLHGDDTIAERTVERWAGEDVSAVQSLLEVAGPVDAIGHRVVHGGARYDQAVLVDDAVLDEILELTSLAPLHQPRAAAGIRVVRALLPDLPAVACFDTTFHHHLPAAAATYALPRAWSARWSLRRYGFHGLSHSYAVRRAAEIVGRPLGELRTVSCHLGAGASLCAVLDGRSVDTTMGFTPLEGLVMKTRSGSIDPGLLLWLQEHGGLSATELGDALAHRSGLAGLSGTSGDLRDVQASAAEGDEDAALAYDVFVHRLAREAAAMTAATGGLDLLVLTGGIGEHQPAVRRDLAERLAYLGVQLDEQANERATGDADIAAPGAPVRMVVIAAREDLEVARQVRELLAVTAATGSPPPRRPAAARPARSTDR